MMNLKKLALASVGSISLLAVVAARGAKPDGDGGTPASAAAPAKSDAKASARKPTTRKASVKPTTKPASQPVVMVGGVPMPREMNVPEVAVPPSPALPPEEAIKSLVVAPGFKVELVAAEPLVEDPVVIKFDGDGRLWVCEMRGYMPHLDPGAKEEEPIGRICVLEDTDGDGRMDKKTVFMDGLVLPRAVSPYRDGVLVAAPPYVWFARDTNGDGKADERQLLAADYTNKSNPEHQPNGLLPALDNWIYNAQWAGRFRYVGDDPAAVQQNAERLERDAQKAPLGTRIEKLDPRWVRVNGPGPGQWGISQDDVGRLFINGNSDLLRGDFVPRALLARNPNFTTTAGVNQRLTIDQSVEPVRATPGINRGYQPHMLDDDHKLTAVTAACSPHVFRGDGLGKDPQGRDLQGDAFVCEPSGNLIKRAVVETAEDGVTLKATHAYRDAEFIASTDERFRPVFLTDGPDGMLYVADLYRGVLQHQRYVTPFLRREVLRRDLEEPIHLGRIYRVVPDGANPAARKPAAKPDMLKAQPADLVQHLSHPSGWWRDTAQQQIVARNDPGVAPLLSKVATTGASPLGRLHALYTLEGLRKLDGATLAVALADADARVRVAALRLAEPFVADANSPLVPAVLKLAADDRDEVRLAFLFTAGTIAAPEARAAVADAYLADPQAPLVRDAVLSGLKGRELELLESLLADQDWADDAPGKGALLGGLAGCVVREGKAERVAKLFALADAEPAATGWRRSNVVSGLTSVANDKNRKATTEIKLDAEPALLAKLEHSTNPRDRDNAKAIAKLVTWPGEAGDASLPAVAKLTEDEQASFERGKVIFTSICAACHQPDGQGEAGKAPSMRGSELLVGAEERPIRVVLHGLRGPVVINGETADMEMPTLAVLSDEQIADTLTYVRREWGHTAGPVTPADVARERDLTKERGQPWTRDELLKLGAKPAAKPAKVKK